MTENCNCQRKNNVNQGVWHDYVLIIEGIMRFEHEKSILLEFRKDKESLISYKIKRIVADTKPSSFNELQNRWNSFNNGFDINEIRRLSWRS